MSGQPGGIGNIVPRDASWVATKFAEYDKRIRELEGAKSLVAALIGSGGITVEGGSVLILDSTTQDRIVELGVITDAFGGEGLVLYRSDGSVAMRFRGDFIGFKDTVGNNVVSDDITSGTGLASPHVSTQMPANTNPVTWPATSGTSFTTIAECYVERQNPGIRWAIFTEADSGVTGSIRITVDGVTVATSPTVTNTFNLWQGTYYWPSGWTFMSTAAVSIDAMVASGSGSVRAQTYQLTGAQSP